MKTLSAAVVGLAIALLAQVAAAYVAQVVTTVPLAAEVNVEDTAELGAILASAVQDVPAHAIAFTPEGAAVLEGLGADPSSADESNMRVAMRPVKAEG
jgi:hypothetical protein